MSLVSDRLEALATCLCAQITADNRPEVCFCGVVPGDAVAADYIGDCTAACGMAWVRLISMYPSSVVGVADATLGNCGKMLGFDVEVGILRCAAVGDEDGNPPPQEVLLAEFEDQMADAMTLRAAIVCCDDSNGFVVGSYTPIGPQGGVYGGFWVVSMQES